MFCDGQSSEPHRPTAIDEIVIDNEDQGKVIVCLYPGEKCIRNIPVLTVVSGEW